MKEITERTLKVENVSLGYGETTIVKDLSLEFPKGNDGKPTHEYSMKGFARMVGLMPQHPIAPEGITVADLVSRGRYPYQGLFKRNSAEDDEAVAWALEATDTMSLAERQVTELSGGQRQRVWIAMALAQETDILLLDEPTTYLDLAHQVELLDLLSDLNEQRGTTMIMVLHELNLAARVADYLVAMKDGSIVAQGEAHDVLTRENLHTIFQGEAHDVLTRENLHTIFGLKAEVADPFNDGSVVVVPHPRSASTVAGSAVAS